MRRLLGRDAKPGDDPSRTPRTKRRLPTPSAGLIVAIVALVVAMAGTAYAGATLGKNSVGAKQLKKGAVTSKKIKKGAVTNGKIAKGAVTAGKLKGGLIVPNASHAKTADSATSATNAANGFVSIGDWTGGIATIPVTSGFVFAGPTTTLTTTAGQSIVATSEAAMATSAATTTADVSICKAPTTGTPTVSLLNTKVGGAFSIVTIGTTRISYPANATGAPGAGTFKIGECVNNTGATNAINNNDFAMGYAYVVNGAVGTGAVPGPPAPVH